MLQIIAHKGSGGATHAADHCTGRPDQFVGTQHEVGHALQAQHMHAAAAMVAHVGRPWVC